MMAAAKLLAIVIAVGTSCRADARIPNSTGSIPETSISRLLSTHQRNIESAICIR
jgi:hypothetical protein